MPEDLKFPFEYDESGDAATVEGREFYERHVLQLALLVTEDLKGSALTGTDIVQAQDAIGRKLSGSPYIESPITVRIDDTTDEETFKASVFANNFSEVEITI